MILRKNFKKKKQKGSKDFRRKIMPPKGESRFAEGKVRKEKHFKNFLFHVTDRSLHPSSNYSNSDLKFI